MGCGTYPFNFKSQGLKSRKTSFKLIPFRTTVAFPEIRCLVMIKLIEFFSDDLLHLSPFIAHYCTYSTARSNECVSSARGREKDLSRPSRDREKATDFANSRVYSEFQTVENLCLEAREIPPPKIAYIRFCEGYFTFHHFTICF